MPNDLPTHYLAARDHLVQLAMTPGWWHYSRQRALELEEESVTHGHGLWLGMREAVRPSSSAWVQAAGKRSGAGGAKYGNKKTVTPDGVKFDSRAEARRWGHLCMQLRAGEISELRRQVAYELVPAVKFADASRVKPAIRYVADFVYVEKGVEVIEDVKGVLTTEFKLKRHLMKALLGLEVRLVK
jgi:hypothetical protein